MAEHALVIYGRLVTFDEEQPVIDDGALYIGADERIAAVQKRTDPAPAGFETAAKLRTNGCVYPGLIDLHNHVVYNVLGLWAPPGQTAPYTSRYDWPGHGSYEEMISDPANARRRRRPARPGLPGEARPRPLLRPGQCLPLRSAAFPSR